MAARKRQGESKSVLKEDDGRQPKRRSARQAAQKEPDADSQIKNESNKAPKGKKGIETVGSVVAESGSKSAAKSKKEPKSKQKNSVTKANEASAGITRAVSEDPDIKYLPDRNPEVERHDGEWYWLMKAEPESRLENGIDVKFSIDDLRQRSEPEPWDGIRAYAARNNLRAMNFGDKAFFYHSNCKEPGIAGIMEIVKEFSEDRSARRPGAPYYDPSSTKEKPKWGLVHVKFVKKFADPITLKEIREMGQSGKPLEQMQMLKQSRLSVSRVSKTEWLHLCQVADQKAEESGLKHET